MRKNKAITCLLMIFFTLSLQAEDIIINKNDWTIKYNESSKTFDYTYKQSALFRNAFPEAKFDNSSVSDVLITPSSYSKVTYNDEAVQDNFGSGTRYTFRFTGAETAKDVALIQRFYLYDDYPYLLTEVSIEGTETLASNYLAPIKSNTSTALFISSIYNRMLKIPWDNDGFQRYNRFKLNTGMTSYEATAIYHGISRKGLVVGSVEHDKWKSAITVKASNNNTVETFTCYSGVANSETMDILPHGKVKGKTVKSAKMLIGFFDDWRLGMEAFGHANTLVVPKRNNWTKGTPFGWNSWAVMAEKNSFQTDLEISDYYKDVLYPGSFHNDQGTVIISIDSWDNLSPLQKTQLSQYCAANGQITGTYCCPFSYWGDNLENTVEGVPVYKYKDCVTYQNGIPAKNGSGAYCLDPTHPAVRANIKWQIDRFRKWGFKYIKADFLNQGAMQADSYYDSTVTTAIQAYNQGFQYFIDQAGDDMFIAESIAPTFPYQYGNSRRITCDTWGKIDQTEYAMNALSSGWWTDQFYQYNDPDHIPMYGKGVTKESLNENRARATSGAITGMYIFGDNFSLTDNSGRGNAVISRERAQSIMMNADINEMANLGRSFMPIYGYKEYNSSTNGAESFFMKHTDKYLYVAVINYYSAQTTLIGDIPLDLLRITADDFVSIKELWTGETNTLQSGKLRFAVPAADARVYRFEKKDTVSAIHTPKDNDKKKVSLSMTSPNTLSIHSDAPISRVDIYNLQGVLLNTENFMSENLVEMTIDNSTTFYIVKCYSNDAKPIVCKFIRPF